MRDGEHLPKRFHTPFYQLSLARHLFDNVKSVSLMMSARRWRNSRVFWRTFIFWAWLSSFVFGFAASDLLHAANCPEQATLRASTHGADSSAHVSAPHFFHLDAHCLSCLLQLSGHAILAAALAALSVCFARAVFACPTSVEVGARVLIWGARGPPAFEL